MTERKGAPIVAGAPIPMSTEMEEAVLALNNAHAVALSWLEREQLSVLLEQETGRTAYPGECAKLTRVSTSPASAS